MGSNLWCHWQRPVEINIVIELTVSILLGDKLVQFVWKIFLKCVLELTLNLVNDRSGEEALERVGNLADEVAMDRDVAMVAWDVNTHVRDGESGDNMSIGERLSCKTQSNSNINIGHCNGDRALGLDK